MLKIFIIGIIDNIRKLGIYPSAYFAKKGVRLLNRTIVDIRYDFNAIKGWISLTPMWAWLTYDRLCSDVTIT